VGLWDTTVSQRLFSLVMGWMRDTLSGGERSFSIVSAICSQGVFVMAVIKMQLLINWGSVAGWSEIYYKEISGSTVSPADQLEAGRQLAQRRALVLTPKAQIIALRTTDVLLPRVTTLQRLAINGQNTQILSSSGPDVPNLAIMATMNSSEGGKRKFLMRGLLDDDVVDGVITLAQSGTGIFNAWWNYLGSGAWRIRDLVPGIQRAVTSVDGATGAISIATAADFSVGDLVTLVSRTAGNGKRIRWTGKILGVGPALLLLKGYKWGNATGGTLTKQTVQYGTIGRFSVPIPQRCRTRQTGRPFDLLRGRVTRR